MRTALAARAEELRTDRHHGATWLAQPAAEALAAVAPEVLPSYVAMARLTADRAIASGLLDAARAGALLEVLGGVPR